MTLTNYPADYSSINEPLLWIFYDANAIDPTKTDYKYVGEVWIGGTKVYTARVFPHPTGAFGVFDFGPVIRGYVSATFQPTVTIDAQELGTAEFRTDTILIKVREEYDGTVGAVIFTDSARVFYNHYNGRISGFTILGDYADKFATTRALNVSLAYASSYYLIPYFATTATPITVTGLADDMATDTFDITPTEANTLQLINISPAAILAGMTGLIGPTTKYYDVTIGAQTIRVNIVCPGMYTNYLLHFMNKFGGFESMLFNKPRKKRLEAEKKEFQQLPYRIDSSGVASVANGIFMHDQKTVFAVKYNEKLSVQTDLLTDAEYQWLSQLITSPMVYLEDAGVMYPVTISSSSYEFKEYIVDRLTNLSLDLEFTTSYNTQFR